MLESTHRASELDARLAEIDRKLRAIQAGLMPEREPSPELGPPEEVPGAEEQPELGAEEPPDLEVSPVVEEPPVLEEPPVPEAPPVLEQPPAPEAPASGRAGPLASVLQRSRRRRPPSSHPLDPQPQISAPRVPEPPGPDRPHPSPGVPAPVAEELLATMRELLEACALTLQAATAQRHSPAAEVSLSAGPFYDNEAVRRFMAQLSAIPTVRGVLLRGYEGQDRALLDVQLSLPSA